MELAGKPKRFGHHGNAFGALRLILASMVIFAHTPELLDGNRGREPLTMIFGTLSFGEFAVNGFFVISGYLIAASFLNSSSPWSYLKKRIARIYPGFILAFALCVLVVAPIGGAALPMSPGGIGRLLLDCLMLQQPMVNGAFPGHPYPVLNGSMWTIAYEFRCYLAVAALGLAGMLRRPGIVLALALLCLALAVALPLKPHVDWNPNAPLPDLNGYRLGELRDALFGNVRQNLRLFAAFLTGTSFYLWRERIRFPRWAVMAAAVMLPLCLFSATLALPAMLILGGYLIFAIARLAGGTWFAAINNENDVSYGVYLYAWPVSKLLIWWLPAAPLAVHIVATWVIAYGLGWASWLLVEKPVMARVRGRKTAAGAAPAAAAPEGVA